MVSIAQKAELRTEGDEPSRPRLDSIDLLRGLVMVIMALDHTRDYLSAASLSGGIDPTNMAQTTPVLFLTRWVTHFCAPTFVFLAGAGAFLYGTRGKSTAQLSWFLFSRGLWLLVLEMTLVRWGWSFNFQYRGEVIDWAQEGAKWVPHPTGRFAWELGGGVIWVIGASMVLMAGLVFLPTSAVAVLGVSLVAFHNLFDGIPPDLFGTFQWAWVLLHSGGAAEIIRGLRFGTGYCLLPWLGVMAAGYAFGALMLLDRPTRRRQLLGLGLSLTLVFIGLRYTNLYGDKPSSSPIQPGPWSEQGDPWLTVCSFLNCQKYPPSLLYLLMTLGPAITALALFDRKTGPVGRFFVVFGRVPLFYYLLHIPLIHAIGIGLDYLRYGSSPLASQGFFGLNPNNVPPGYGHSLPVVYLIWGGVVLALFPVCWWFAGIKRRYRAAWLSYL